MMSAELPEPIAWMLFGVLADWIFHDWPMPRMEILLQDADVPAIEFVAAYLDRHETRTQAVVDALAELQWQTEMNALMEVRVQQLGENGHERGQDTA
jgi:hypothetical protein